MPIVIKNRSTLIQDIANTIKTRDQAIETNYGPVKDVLIDPVSLVARDLYLQVKNVFDIQFLKNADIMSREELDLLGESFGFKRKPPQFAVGTVFFRTSSKPSADIFIPIGTPVATRGIASGAGGIQSFVTTRSVTLFATSANAFLNPSEGVFEIEAPIRALTPGSLGLVAAGTISTIQKQIVGISSVTNKSSTFGGRDFESNSEYVRRIRLALLGADKGTVGGLKKFALSDDRVIDALPVISGDPLLIRQETNAGAVDVYILAEEPTINDQTIIFDGLDVLFDNEPLIFPTPVISVVGDIFGSLTEGTHYFIIPDVIKSGSSKATNILRWNRGLTATQLPAIGESVSIEYVYDKLIQDLQKSIDDPQNDLLADVLFRRSIQIDILIEATIKVFSDADLQKVAVSIKSALTSFINTLGLGEDVIPSDLDEQIRAVPGVDFVFLPFDRLSKKEESSGSGIVQIEKNEFANISDTNITLNLST